MIKHEDPRYKIYLTDSYLLTVEIDGKVYFCDTRDLDPFKIVFDRQAANLSEDEIEELVKRKKAK